jgi:DNA-directed RNA polymerase specialized sigma24 family protein
MATQTVSSEMIWAECYPQLYKQARKFVERVKVANWHGQEDDIAWDATQESMRKVFEYTQNKKEPIQALHSFLKTTMQHSILDLRRREKRLYRETTEAPLEFVDRDIHFSEAALESVFQERIFRVLARAIAQFPCKQRRALLADLAGRMAFGRTPTALQAAFQAEGICLEEYRHLQPQNERERSRNAALLYQAYRRLRGLEEVKQYLA